MPGIRRIALLATAACSLSLGLSTTGAAGAPAEPMWAPAATAAIHPGVQTLSPVGGCTANFVFFDEEHVYIGQAAHCTGTGGSTETNGCEAGSLPLGTAVVVGGAAQPATMVYNSWLAMQANMETDPSACAYNDFALLRLHPADAVRVNPSVPHWGGPVGINTEGCPPGHKVYSYGNSPLRLGLTLLSPHVGFCQGDAGDGWTHEVSILPPELPGDSGSAYLDRAGRALGNLSTIAIAIPGAIVYGVSDMHRQLSYLRGSEEALSDVRLALGTEPFRPRQLPIGVRLL